MRRPVARVELVAPVPGDRDVGVARQAHQRRGAARARDVHDHDGVGPLPRGEPGAQLVALGGAQPRTAVRADDQPVLPASRGRPSLVGGQRLDPPQPAVEDPVQRAERDRDQDQQHQRHAAQAYPAPPARRPDGVLAGRQGTDDLLRGRPRAGARRLGQVRPRVEVLVRPVDAAVAAAVPSVLPDRLTLAVVGQDGGGIGGPVRPSLERGLLVIRPSTHGSNLPHTGGPHTGGSGGQGRTVPLPTVAVRLPLRVCTRWKFGLETAASCDARWCDGRSPAGQARSNTGFSAKYTSRYRR